MKQLNLVFAVPVSSVRPNPHMADITARPSAPISQKSSARSRPAGMLQLQYYRVYFVGQDGRIKSIDLSGADDSSAIESAEQLIDGSD